MPDSIRHPAIFLGLHTQIERYEISFGCVGLWLSVGIHNEGGAGQLFWNEPPAKRYDLKWATLQVGMGFGLGREEDRTIQVSSLYNQELCHMTGFLKSFSR
jgi:hypothetical protein